MTVPTTKAHLVVAAAEHNAGIGVNGALPWRLKADMRYFARLTSSAITASFPIPASHHQSQPSLYSPPMNIVIMGRRTWESVPLKFRPLKGRINIILSRNSSFKSQNPDLTVFSTLDDALAHARSLLQLTTVQNPQTQTTLIPRIFIIGGASVYTETIARPDCGYIYLTSVKLPADKLANTTFDVFMPPLTTTASLSTDANGIGQFRRLATDEIINNEYVVPKAVAEVCFKENSLCVFEDGYDYEYQVYEKLSE
ncbi:hypothetical protein HK100_011692 [Physocladia obscura]|uniref:Dihydrofolate reductase n=1 Tax=Physocladia obscura TaxID=109957 RepID=A0AAD5T0U7_9FUNG|nr:hypothetical protein HK100_011692 [Physocladia obscura]